MTSPSWLRPLPHGVVSTRPGMVQTARTTCSMISRRPRVIRTTVKVGLPTMGRITSRSRNMPTTAMAIITSTSASQNGRSQSVPNWYTK